jgi:hypothetical protein
VTVLEAPGWNAWGLFTATQAFSATESDRLTPIGLRRRAKPNISERFVASLERDLIYGHRIPSWEARIAPYDH